MPAPPAAEIVRLLFEAARAADVKRVCALLDPEVDATTTRGTHYHGLDQVRRFFTDEGSATEVLAHQIETEPDGSIIARGRIRVHGPGSLADSPAAWRLTVSNGRVATIEALTGDVARSAAAAA